jgi:ribosomal protein S18 acetylase RimI-like enzyme
MEMQNPDIEIRPLTVLDPAEIHAVVTGYESYEKYAVEKTESEAETVITARLVRLETPHRAGFAEDFTERAMTWFAGMLPQGYSFGAYHAGRLVALAIAETQEWTHGLRIWEFHVMRAYHRQGIGRALMRRVVDQAAQAGLRIVVLETQNTNVRAIRFYRSIGFHLGALDLALYTNHDMQDGEVCFYMHYQLPAAASSSCQQPEAAGNSLT